MMAVDLSLLTRPKKFIRGMPAPSQCPDGTILGNYSLKLPNGLRVIDIRKSIDYRGIWDTQTAFTRCYLKQLPKRRQRREQREALQYTNPPQYCQPGETDRTMMYVDIRSAYLSIYSRMSWDIEYLRGKYFSNNGGDTLDYPFPLEWKTGRSYVVTGSLPGSRRVVYGGSVRNQKCVNPYENASLVCAVWDVLSAIAWEAVHIWGARYWNLDGGVFSEKDAERFQVWLEEFLGLESRVKYHGSARLRNLGNWRVGDHQTARYGDDKSPIHHVDTIAVCDQDARWILNRFSRL